MKRLQIFIGNYGSGKTEIAINMALTSASATPTMLVDMDVVNPYFRSSEQRALLEQKNITVIAPAFAGTNVDLPVLGAEVERAFIEKDKTVFFDVGGDPAGARVLGMYHHKFLLEPPEVNYVINVRRPMSANPDDIIETLQMIEKRARMNVTCLINNTNLAMETTVDDLMFGQKIIEECSKKLNLPIRFICGQQHVLKQLISKNVKAKKKLLQIKIFMRPEWLDL